MRSFLLGHHIVIMADHCPLCHIMEKTVKNSRVNRITHLIEEYNIEKVIHIKGRENCLSDFLSRYSRERDDDLFEIDYGLRSKDSMSPSITSSLIKSKLSSSSTSNNASTLAAMTLRPRKHKRKLVSATTFVDNDVITDNNSQTNSSKNISGTDRIPPKFSHNHFDMTKLKDEQDQDPKIQQIIQQLLSKTNNLSFIFKNNILYKLKQKSNKVKRKLEVIYLPKSMVPTLLQACHDVPMTGGHFSTNRMYYKVKRQYWWPHSKKNKFHTKPPKKIR